MKIRSLAILVAAFMVTLVASPALAVYHPGMGRFLQRDPNGMQIGPAVPHAIAGPAAHGGFVQRDFEPHQQYADGMNLYQYVGCNPIGLADPTGLRSIGIGDGSLFRPRGPGRCRFRNCTAGELADLLVIPEDGTDFVRRPQNEQWYDCDGIRIRGDDGRRWLKVPNHCDLTFGVRRSGRPSIGNASFVSAY
jgi:hypothetical protein